MLSYRHAYHAGNHADVLKHFLLVHIIEYMQQKTSGFVYLDSHAGCGLYDLSSEIAAKTAEFTTGIHLLQNAPDLPEPLHQYLQISKQMQRQFGANHYFGSAAIAAYMLRSVDRGIMCELHPQDFASLKRNIATLKSAAKIHCSHSDGLLMLNASLPVRERRALVLIDPAYELQSEMQQVRRAIQTALSKMPNCVIALWYPIINGASQKSAEAIAKIAHLKINGVLNFVLNTTAPGSALGSGASNAKGMTGSGVLLINPPFNIEHKLQSAMAALTHILARDSHASFAIDSVLPRL